MKIHHLAIWVDDLEGMKNFYLKYFEASCGSLYVNPVKKFSSYFISFSMGGSQIELMHRPGIDGAPEKRGFNKGIAHLAITVGDKEKVNAMVENFRQEGYMIQGEPRTTGDGYYEAVVLDPEGNLIELLAG
ncbi:VOC family protein [Chitinophaga tropicalis]|uniref:Glyoxalase/bleomycin resistance/extradiol dioxygenase family protein n=1 Tax=Chitinophaga tropicalis TaxID=2683588 RepID=A0A7K1UCP3_9BACT|nr:VOC family protein [Chitinophaga tropicalis]MVT12086.1 glyoxalase/bleomycin resistance/extradiol dioxygenase family protein [Chitinophaga tropicalis]